MRKNQEVAMWGEHDLLLTIGKGCHVARVGLRRKQTSYLCCLEEIANSDRHLRWYGKTKDDLAMIEAGEHAAALPRSAYPHPQLPAFLRYHAMGG